MCVDEALVYDFEEAANRLVGGSRKIVNEGL